VTNNKYNTFAIMPLSAAQKLKRKAKRKAKKAHGAGGQKIAGPGAYRKVGSTTTRLRGRGNYLSDAVDAVSGVANYAPKTSVGRAAQSGITALTGDMGVPKSISGALGNAAGWLTKLFGFGAYSTYNNVKRNSFMGGTGVSGFQTNAPPTFAGSAKATTIRIRHDEFITDVLSSVDFHKTTYSLNPGNTVLMPWGSALSGLYEEFKWHGVVFEYRSTSAFAVGTTSSAMGTVLMATDYDAYDDNFVDKRTMEAAMFATSSSPFEGTCHPIECAKSMNPVNTMFVQKGVPTAASVQGDARLDILGNFTIATVGQQAADTKIGELWVHYDLELSRPMLESGVAPFGQQLSGAAATGGAWYFQQNTKPGGGFTATYGSGSTWNHINLSSADVPVGVYLIACRTTTSEAINGYANPNPFLVSGSVTIRTADCYNRTTGIINTDNMHIGAADGTVNEGIAVTILNVTGPGVFTYISPFGSTGTNYVDIYIASYQLNSNYRRGRRVMDVDVDVVNLNAQVLELRNAVKALSLASATTASADVATSSNQVAPMSSPVTAVPLRHYLSSQPAASPTQALDQFKR